MLYKVHRYFLIRESAFFKDMFSLPQGQSEQAEGLSDKIPITLSGATQEEIGDLFQYLYFGYTPISSFNGMCTDSLTYYPPVLSMLNDYLPNTDTWTRLLMISTRLEFDGIRRHAIAKLSVDWRYPITPIHKLSLALKYDVEEWLEPAYADIVAGKESLSFKEAGQLPWDIAAMLFRSREIYHHPDNVMMPSTHTSAKSPPTFSFGTPGSVPAAPVAEAIYKRTAKLIVAEQLKMLKQFKDDERAKLSTEP